MKHGYNNPEYSFTVVLQGQKYNGSWTDTQITGTNTNGMFQVILPENAPNGRYAIEIRNLHIDHFGTDPIHYVKVYLTNLPMTNGYNNANQSNSTLYGVFDVQSKANKNVVSYTDNGDRPWTQQVNGLPFLRNGQIGVKIANPDETAIAMDSGHTWIMTLDFKKISD